MATADLDCGEANCRAIKELCCQNEVTNVTCSDGIDNDQNGFADCDEFACRSGLVTVCQSENCTNMADDDGDLLVDCDDPDCEAACVVVPETPEDSLARCQDGADNDRNGFTDCDDFACSRDGDAQTVAYCASLQESTLAQCSDGVDNDGNGFIDCDDFGCSLDGDPGAVDYCESLPQERTLEACTDRIDNDGNGYIDCDDFSCSRDGDLEVIALCEEIDENTFTECKDGLDNDRDGFSDCADRSCTGLQASEPDPDYPGDPSLAVRDPCQEAALEDPAAAFAQCTDGFDNDRDGFTDCEDWDCHWLPALNPGFSDRTFTGPLSDEDIATRYPCLDQQTGRAQICGG